MTFIPEQPQTVNIPIPYFEDATGREIPGRHTDKRVSDLQAEVKANLIKLGASQVFFQAGKFENRYGYRIEFYLGGIPGRIDCAGLPMRSETDKKKDRVLAQALFLIRDWLQGEYNALIYRPGALPLLPYLVGQGGKTVSEELAATQHLALLPMGVKGEIVHEG